MATSTPTIATTTRSSVSVNPRVFLLPLFISLSILNYPLPGDLSPLFFIITIKNFQTQLYCTLPISSFQQRFISALAIIHFRKHCRRASKTFPIASFAAKVSALTPSRTNQQHPLPADIAKAPRLIHQNSISSLHDNYDVSLNDPF